MFLKVQGPKRPGPPPSSTTDPGLSGPTARQALPKSEGLKAPLPWTIESWLDGTYGWMDGWMDVVDFVDFVDFVHWCEHMCQIILRIICILYKLTSPNDMTNIH